MDIHDSASSCEGGQLIIPNAHFEQHDRITLKHFRSISVYKFVKLLICDPIKDKTLLAKIKPTRKQRTRGCIERRAINSWEYTKYTGDSRNEHIERNKYYIYKFIDISIETFKNWKDMSEDFVINAIPLCLNNAAK